MIYVIRAATRDCKMRALQLGMAWFAEQPGGLDRYYAELIGRLPAAGVECRGWIAGSDLAERQTGGVVRAFAPSSAPMLKRWWAARRAVRHDLRRQPVDLVAAHFALYLLPVLGAIDGLPLVVHFHGPWAAESAAEGASAGMTWARRQIERRAYGRADVCIVLSAAFARVLHESYNVPMERIRVVPGGVDVQRFATTSTRLEARQGLSWPTDRPIVLCVRRLVSRMGLESLIDAAEQLRRQHKEVLILIAGKGRLRDALAARIEQKSLADTVRLLGFVPDEQLPLAYRAADLTVVPSAALEGFGLIAAESLAAGTPALVAPVGGLPEVVRDLSADLVLEDSGAAAISQGVGQALRGPMQLPDDQQCRLYARQRFDWSIIVSQVREVYEQCLASHRIRTARSKTTA